jgi:hypothetical protein
MASAASCAKSRERWKSTAIKKNGGSRKRRRRGGGGEGGGQGERLYRSTGGRDHEIPNYSVSSTDQCTYSAVERLSMVRFMMRLVLNADQEELMDE